ncbi:MAG: hypothetical protein HDR98_01070 [Bacteroides sp.]|nr:hypothetical protein [Bacteroides sp.]
MKSTLDRIKNYVQLHTEEMEDAAYIDLMRGLAEWAAAQADAFEYREETEIDNNADE